MDSAAGLAHRSPFASRDFQLYQGARLLMTLGAQMQAVAVGLHVYGLTQRPLYGVLGLLGATRAFIGPASQSLVPHMVPAEHLSRAVAWNSAFFQAGTIIGPAAGGVLYGALGAQGVYAVCAALMAAASVLLALMRVRTGRQVQTVRSWQRLWAGLHSVWHQKVVLGAISLDLFAVLVGGAVALLPIYAQDILDIGPAGLGLLRSAPAVGAVLIAVLLAGFPLQRHTGVMILACMALFGAATVAFGLSRHLLVAVGALVVLGAADMVNVVIRQTLVQLATSPELRGRVDMVSMVFAGASNELGDFKSGVRGQARGNTSSGSQQGRAGGCSRAEVCAAGREEGLWLPAQPSPVGP